MDEQSLGRHLQTARLSVGLTQQELCQRAKISYSTLAKIERGAIKSPSVFTIVRLAEVLNTTLDQLMGSMPETPKERNGRSRSGVTFVYFDINGCLVRFFHRAFTAIAEESGASAELIEMSICFFLRAGNFPKEMFSTGGTHLSEEEFVPVVQTITCGYR